MQAHHRAQVSAARAFEKHQAGQTEPEVVIGFAHWQAGVPAHIPARPSG